MLESVNSAVRVYDTSGTPLGGVVSLNEFYGLPPAIDRSTFTFPGPFMFDIECHFDPASQRWFHLSASIEQDPTTGATPGENDINLAVSKSANPLGEWAIYRIPGQNDGTEGTPDHDCAGGPCFADFPHLGVDANGVYITTNEFPFFETGFIGAQIYAISKQVLVSTPMSVPITLINTADDPVKPDQPGFTVWPAKSAGAQFAGAANGTEFFLSSNAVFNDNGESDELIVWALTNTQSLDSGTPSLQLRKTIVPVNRYAVPSNSAQKPGTTPLRDCLNDRSHALGRGQNCWELFFARRPAFQPLGTIDNGDSRVLDVRFANGRLWGVLGTAAEVDGRQRTGAGWYILDAAASSSGVSASVAKQGILALADASLAYPTVGVTTSGRGVLGFSLVGENNFPSAAFAPIDAVVGAGAVSVSEEGKSPQDGFSEYPVFGSPRPRWGDYSASAVDGATVYSATEYIEQGPCTLSEYLATGLTCTGERTSLANWATRVSKLKP